MFTIQARRRMNPDIKEEFIDTLVKDIKNLLDYAKWIQTNEHLISDSDVDVIAQMLPKVDYMYGQLLKMKIRVS